MSTNNNTTIIVPLDSPEAVFRLFFYVCSLVLGTLGGVVVLAVILSKRSKKTDHDIFLINLAMADMITIWFYVGVRFRILSGILWSSDFCRYIWPLMSVPLCVSIFTIVSMAIIRFRWVVVTWAQPITQTVAIIWVVGLWVVAFVVFIPACVVSREAGHYCYLEWSTSNQRKMYAVSLFVIQYFLPLTIVLCCYIGIGLNLTKYEGQVERANIRQENRDIIKALAAIVFIFAVFLMPLQIGFMMWEFGGIPTKKFVQTFMNFSDILCLFHSCLNPFVYGIVPREFRDRYSHWASRLYHSLTVHRPSNPLTEPQRQLNDVLYQRTPNKALETSPTRESRQHELLVD